MHSIQSWKKRLEKLVKQRIAILCIVVTHHTFDVLLNTKVQQCVLQTALEHAHIAGAVSQIHSLHAPVRSVSANVN